MIQTDQLCLEMLSVKLCSSVFALIAAALFLHAHVGTSHPAVRSLSPCDELFHALVLFLFQTFHPNSIARFWPFTLSEI